MRVAGFGFMALAVLWLGSAFAEDLVFEPMPLLDLAGVNPEFADDMFGQWMIHDASGEKSCAIELKRDVTIGGMEIGVDPACEKVFPVMADITAWRLLEGWAIDLADVERKTRVRFSTLHERYVAIPEVDGIATIEQVPLD
jgi:hypothetical protein